MEEEGEVVDHLIQMIDAMSVERQDIMLMTVLDTEVVVAVVVDTPGVDQGLMEGEVTLAVGAGAMAEQEVVQHPEVDQGLHQGMMIKVRLTAYTRLHNHVSFYIHYCTYEINVD